jgi:hypothetical protein
MSLDQGLVGERDLFWRGHRALASPSSAQSSERQEDVFRAGVNPGSDRTMR